MDRILIKDIMVRCIIGVNKEERREKQDVVINVILYLDLRQAGKTDQVQHTVDYSDIKKKIIAMVEPSQYLLLEALAERIAAICLDNRMVEQVQVSVEKPGALRFARTVGVEILRRQV